MLYDQSIVLYICSVIKLWMFYGSSNNLRLANDIIFVRHVDFEAIKRIEDEFINPLINTIYPKFKEMEYQIYLCGKTYSKPIDDCSIILNFPNVSKLFILNNVNSLPTTTSTSRRRRLSASNLRPNVVPNIGTSTSPNPSLSNQRSRQSSRTFDGYQQGSDRYSPPYPFAPPPYTNIDTSGNRSANPMRRSSVSYQQQPTTSTRIRSRSDNSDAGHRQSVRETWNLDLRNRDYYFSPVFVDDR